MIFEQNIVAEQKLSRNFVEVFLLTWKLHYLYFLWRAGKLAIIVEDWDILIRFQYTNNISRSGLSLFAFIMF